jgi:hypothetical protein
MLPIHFPEANDEYTVNGTTKVPIYEDHLQTIVCYQFNKEELDTFFKNGKLWLRIPGSTRRDDKPAPYIRPTVYNPFKQMEPLEVSADIAEQIIIHIEDDEEIIIYKIETGAWLMPEHFSEKVKIVGWGKDLPEYTEAIHLYKLCPDDVYILKRVRNE